MATMYRDGGKGSAREMRFGSPDAIRYDFRFTFTTRDDTSVKKLEVGVQALNLEEAMHMIKMSYPNFWVLLDQECVGKNKDWLTGGRKHKPVSKIQSVKVC